MKVFFDHNLSPKIPKALDALFKDKHKIIHLKDRFSPDVSDEKWINELSSEGSWIVFSGDMRITKNEAEKRAFRNSKLTGLFLSPGLFKKGPVIQTARLLLLWDNIEKISEIVAPGATYQISENRIKQI